MAFTETREKGELSTTHDFGANCCECIEQLSMPILKFEIYYYF